MMLEYSGGLMSHLVSKAGTDLPLTLESQTSHYSSVWISLDQ